MAAGGARALAADDLSGNGHDLVVWVIAQGVGGNDVRQLFADQCHGVRAGGHAGAGEVGLQALEGVHWCEWCGEWLLIFWGVILCGHLLQVCLLLAFPLGIGEQVIGIDEAFDLPQSVASVCGQGRAVECADAGENTTFSTVELGAEQEVWQTAPGTAVAFGDDAFGRFGVESVHLTETEPHGRVGFDCAAHLRVLNTHGKYLDAVTASILDECGAGVKTHRLVVEQSGVKLEPCDGL